MEIKWLKMSFLKVKKGFSALLNEKMLKASSRSYF